MPKQIQGLEKRVGSIIFVGTGKALDMEDLRVGDLVKVKKTDGTTITIKVDIIQEEETFLGTVEAIGPQPKLKTNGIECGDYVVENIAFVFEINRAT